MPRRSSGRSSGSYAYRSRNPNALTVRPPAPTPRLYQQTQPMTTAPSLGGAMAQGAAMGAGVGMGHGLLRTLFGGFGGVPVEQVQVN